MNQGGIIMSTFDRQNLKKSPRIAFRVSDHAMERFRERVEEEFVHRNHDDLSDLLNARLRSAVLVRDVIDPRVPDLVTTLYMFETRAGTRQVAVVRESCVITVLDDWMARNNYPGWDDEPIATLGATPLGDKLRAIALAPAPVLAPASVLAPTSAAPPPTDEYLVLATECRDLAARGRDLCEQRDVLTEQLRALSVEIQEVEGAFAAKRDRLLTLMTEGKKA